MPVCYLFRAYVPLCMRLPVHVPVFLCVHLCRVYVFAFVCTFVLFSACV